MRLLSTFTVYIFADAIKEEKDKLSSKMNKLIALYDRLEETEKALHGTSSAEESRSALEGVIHFIEELAGI